MDPTDDGIEGEGGSYLVSVSDLMIGLLFVFLLMLMVFAVQYARTEHKIRQEVAHQKQITQEIKQQLLGKVLDVQQKLTAAEKAREALLQALAHRLRQEGVPVRVVAANGVLRLEDPVLFATFSADLSDRPLPSQPDGPAPATIVSRLATALADTLPCYSSGAAKKLKCPQGSEPILEAVLVEGNADNRPITDPGPFKDNYDLSVARAEATYQALVKDQRSLSGLTNTNAQKLFGLSGFGSNRPVSTGRTRTDLARNRGIDLRFLLATPPPESFDPLLQDLRRNASPVSP